MYEYDSPYYDPYNSTDSYQGIGLGGGLALGGAVVAGGAYGASKLFGKSGRDITGLVNSGAKGAGLLAAKGARGIGAIGLGGGGGFRALSRDLRPSTGFFSRGPLGHLMAAPGSFLGWFGIPVGGPSGAVRNVMKSTDLGVKSGFKAVAKGALKSIPGLALGPLVSAGFIGYDTVANDIPLSLALSKFTRDAAYGTAGGALGASIGSLAGPIGSLVGFVGGSTAGMMIGESNSVINQAISAGHKKMGGYQSTSFNANVQGGLGKGTGRGSLYDSDTYTMRQRSLQAIHKSPLNDRARLLGREAGRMHM